MVTSFFVNLLALAVPVFVLQVYDRVVFHAGISTLYGLVIGMAMVLAFDFVLRQARARVMQTVALRIDVTVGRELFNKFMSLPLQMLESRPANYWQSLFRDVDVVRNTVSGASAILVADLPFVVMFLGLVFVIAAPIAWILLIILPLFLFVAWRSGNTMSKINHAERETSMARDGLIAEMIGGRLLGPLNQLVGTWRTYASFKESVERLGQVFNTPSERTESEVRLDRPAGQITLEEVTFAYADGAAPVVDNVSLTLRAGGVHALVGRNGSGKTTLLKLIQGLYASTNGRVLIDDADIAQFTRSELAGWMGYVPQECVLFAGSIRDNIAHRIPDATDEQVVQAATAAGVHSYIIDLPDGYGTEIGEAGRRLSGGQRQRIAIARALVGDPPVVLLDEPSSSLDRQAEHELRGTLAEIGKERSVIIVTHSPILLSTCQDLVALDRGRVALAGPAEEILPRLFGGAKGGGGGGAQRRKAAGPADAAQRGAAAAPAQQPASQPTPGGGGAGDAVPKVVATHATSVVKGQVTSGSGVATPNAEAPAKVEGSS